jgi:hypothetical protein
MALIAARLTPANRRPDDPEDTRTLHQRRFDALLEAVTTNLSVFVDLVGYLNPDGTVSLPSLPGIGDLEPEQLTRLVAGGTLRFHNPANPPPPTAEYAWTEAQRRYLCARDRTCRFPGCTIAADRCELDHITPYRDGGPTDVHNGLALCKRHHRLKHQPGWKIQRFTDDQVDWTSPTGHTLTDHPWTTERR